MKRKIDENLILAAVFGEDSSSSKQEIEIDERLKLSEFHVNLERRYVSKSYSSRILTNAQWNKQMHFLLFNNFTYAKSYVGHKNFKDYCNLSPGQYTDVCESLEDKGFICREKISEKPGCSPKDTRTITTSYLAPVYNPDTDTLIKQKILNTSFNTNIHKIHYFEVPKEGFDEILKDKRLKIIHKKLMFKLYRFNKYQLFRGVDPNFIYRENGTIHMSYRLLDDLRLSRREAEEILKCLERYGYFFWNSVNIYKETIDAESRLRVLDEELDISREVEVITPTYQLEREVIK